MRMINRPVWRPSFAWLVGFGLLAACLLTFGELAEAVWQQESFAWDAPVAVAIHQVHPAWLDVVMGTITETGASGALVVALLVAGWWWWQRRYATTVALLVSWQGATSLNGGLKLLFRRPHPHLFPPLLIRPGYSFPSGHTSAAAGVYGFLAIMLWRQRHYGWALFGVLWVVAVAISRVYLGAHFPSDVLGSLTLGTVWLALIFTIYDWYGERLQHHLDQVTNYIKQALAKRAQVERRT